MNRSIIPVLSFHVGENPHDRMGSDQSWLAMTLVPIPYAQRRTIGPGDYITVLNGGDVMKARGASRDEAVQNLRDAVAHMLGNLDQVAVEQIEVVPIPRENPSSV